MVLVSMHVEVFSYQIVLLKIFGVDVSSLVHIDNKN